MSYEDASSNRQGQVPVDGWAEATDGGAEPKPRRLRAILFALLAIFLVWQIIIRSYVAYLADNSPETALKLRPGDATALVNLAESRLIKLREMLADKSRNEPDAKPQEIENSFAKIEAGHLKKQITSLVTKALLDEPLNARALAILGELASSDADKVRTTGFMAAAKRLSLRESGSLFWLMNASYEAQDYDKVVDYADGLLRTRGGLASYVVPYLGRIAENKESAPKLKKTLAQNPRWREQFFALLPKNITNPHTPLDLLLGLKGTKAHATTREIRGYLNFLIDKRFFEIAYYTWLQFLPPDELGKAGFLYNGGFETMPDGLPFDWNLNPSSGVTIDIAVRPDEEDGHALFIEFGHGRVQFRDITQMTMLAPGHYRLQGQLKGQIIGRRGLIWRIKCIGGNRLQLGESQMFVGVARRWKPFELTFTVPDRGCRAQSLILHFDARSSSEQLVTGAAWYDDLKISRFTEPAVVEKNLP